jgi:hypothetical protein
LGIWVSSKSKGTFFKNIICVEISGANQSLKDVITNLFAVISFLEIQGNKNSSIAIPLIGTGDQSLDPEMVTDILLDTSVEFLKYSRYLNKVYFVVRNDEKAQLLNRQMNIKLGRAKVKSPRGELAALLRKDLNNNIDALIDRYENEEVFKDLKRVLNKDFRPFEFGAITRKVIEKIINELCPASRTQFELIKKIESLNNIGISQWIQSYFHTIRIFGNEAVHSKDNRKRKPEYVDEKDLEIGMYCISKIIEFYLNYDKSRNLGTD